MQRPTDGIQNTTITQVIAKPFLKLDFKPHDLETIYKYAGISDFSSGVDYQGQTDIENETVRFLFFEYGESQTSVLMFLQGWPIPFGRTEDCK